MEMVAMLVLRVLCEVEVFPLLVQPSYLGNRRQDCPVMNEIAEGTDIDETESDTLVADC